MLLTCGEDVGNVLQHGGRAEQAVELRVGEAAIDRDRGVCEQVARIFGALAVVVIGCAFELSSAQVFLQQ